MPELEFTQRAPATVQREAQMRSLSLERAATGRPAECRVVMQPLDGSGAFDESVIAKRFAVSDDPERENANARTVVSDFRAALLSAVVPDTPQARRLEALTGQALVGQSVHVMSGVLLAVLSASGLMTVSEG